MKGYDERSYGAFWAADYDQVHGELDPAGAVETLAELAAGRPVLELAIGTGRIALPLKERGVEIHGVDISEPMLAELRGKPGGAEIPVTVGNFAEADYGGEFPLIFLAFNTLFALLSQEEQVRMFANVARQLTPDGLFIVEAFVPDLSRYARGQSVSVTKIELDSVQLDFGRHDPVNQIVDVQVATFGERGTTLRPIRLRYAWPAELDLMARLAGLRLRERWGGWAREEFQADSRQHVSLYGRP
ncbi:MAG TPA: methyltransferase domain-containing protein [Gaiellaceae bacterium]